MLAEPRDNAFRISVAGPSRVGKTSLIAAILSNSRDLLAGSPVEIVPEGLGTERRLTQHRQATEGSLRAGQFIPDSIRPTQEPFVFELGVSAGDSGGGVQLQILDYPGGWLDPDSRPELRADDWKECRSFIKECTVLIVPIDAALIMEAVEPKHMSAVPSMLTTTVVEDIAMSWAKERNQRAAGDVAEPGLLLLCPLKCESYFADNGGTRDASAELLKAVSHYYDGLLEAVRKEAPNVEILYSPVDTIGCVELVSAEWQGEQATESGLEFNAKYRVRAPGRQMVKGADSTLLTVCKHIYEVQSQVEAAAARAAKDAAKVAEKYAELDEGIFRNVWFRLNGERKARLETAESRSAEATAAAGRAEAFSAVITELAKRPPGPRAVKW